MCLDWREVLVVSGAVFDEVMKLVQAGHEIDSNGFYWECQREWALARRSGDEHRAKHWNMVLEFGTRASWNRLAAYEVEGELIRDTDPPCHIAPSGLWRTAIGTGDFDPVDYHIETFGSELAEAHMPHHQ